MKRHKARPARQPVPLPPFIVAIGVTGHRAQALEGSNVQHLETRVRDTLVMIEEAARASFDTDPRWFAPGPAQLRLVSPLADGADQMIARVAISLGWELQAIVPFSRAEYRATLPDEARHCFDELLARSAVVLELPGDPAEPLGAYVMTAHATVAHCDLLVAVWDGERARGPGGTAEAVQLALTKGKGIVHIPVDQDAECRLIWSAFDPAAPTIGEEPSVSRRLDAAELQGLVGRLMLPPANADQQKHLQKFVRERDRKIRARFEYPLLLAAVGVRRMRARDFTFEHSDREIRQEWRRYRSNCLVEQRLGAAMDFLEEAYAWADRLATHFAQTYRSGHIFNFVLGALAVCMGLATLMAPQIQFQEAFVEMLITVAIIANAVVGSRRAWHRRWLDYRQLAERLRPMRSLKLLGIAAPDPPGTRANPISLHWVDWYAMAVWRAIGVPSVSIKPADAATLGRAVAEHEVEPQIEYHRRNARQVDLLDGRLERLSLGLFAITLLVSVATLVGFAFHAGFVNTYNAPFMVIQAGFPALGTAIFGIRFQGDFGGDAVRSINTADTLQQIAVELRANVCLMRAANLLQQAARVMLADLDEWRVINQQRELDFG